MPTGGQRDGRHLVAVGLILLVAGVLANEWLLVGPKSEIAAPVYGAIRAAQAALIAAGAAVLLLRRRLAALLQDEPRTLCAILWAGLALRVAVYGCLGPHNNDPHFAVVRFLAEHGRFPDASESVLSFQAPLYYLLAAPLAMLGSAKAVQLLSLGLSLFNLLMLGRLISTSRVVTTFAGRTHAMLLAALMPQFVLFGSFVSNDALALPLGTAVFLAGFRFAERPARAPLLWLGILVGLGLLTKGTANAFLVSVPLVLVAIGMHRRWPLRRHATTLLTWGALAVALGSYKYIANLVQFGTPVADNSDLQMEYVQWQGGTYQGVRSLIDCSVWQLVRDPRAGEHTRHSLPLLYYGTFWYSHIPESSFRATLGPVLILVPRLLYALAVVPTVLMGTGLVSCLWRNRAPRSALADDAPGFARRVQEVWPVAVLLLHLAIVTAWGLRHDAWSFFQARLLFPAWLALSLILGRGVEACVRRTPRLARPVSLALGTLYALFVVYYAVEIGYLLALKT